MALTSLAQDSAPPDISGNWALNLGKSTLAKDSKVISETLSISAKKSTVVIHYKTDGKKSTESYTLDGHYHVTHEMSSGDLMSKAHWEGSTLVIESVLQIKIPNVTVSVSGLKPVVDKWTVSPDGKSLSYEAPDASEVRVYDRQ